MKHSKLFLLLAVAGIATMAYAKLHERETADGIAYGIDATDKVAFHGATPIAQATLTDSTTGDAGTALAAGVGVQTIAIPLNLAAIADGDVLTNYTPGYKFKVLSVSFAVNTIATTSSKATSLNLEIGTTNVTGGVVALTTSNCGTLGALVAGSSITAANTGSASATLSVEASSTTAFVEGSGYLLIKIQNMDTADAVASFRAILANKGLVGS